jgi:dTDP-4-dehydrorhamnose reductase
MKVWITGSRGLIGNELVRQAPLAAPGWEIIGLTREPFDLTNYPALRAAFQHDLPDLVIHCAAISRSPVCQAQPDLAWTTNYGVTVCLADLATNIPFLLLSSEQVFDGSNGPYDESSPVHPVNVYGETKAAAEQFVLANPRHTVVRLALTYGQSPAGDRAFNEEMVRAWQRGETLRLFTDEFRCPIPAPVVARALWELTRQDQPGLYHLAGAERLSRFQIGQLLAARPGRYQDLIQPALRKDYQGPPRPADLTMICAKIQKLLSFPLPGLSQWLASPAS